jgi:hypothetical protein
MADNIQSFDERIIDNVKTYDEACWIDWLPDLFFLVAVLSLWSQFQPGDWAMSSERNQEPANGILVALS